MFVETLECQVRLVRPRSFAGLMTLYESNHIRLRQLLGRLTQLPASQVSASATDLPLHVTLLERSRYTSGLRLTYRFDDVYGLEINPDLTVRVYHDARLAEAVSSCERPRPTALGAAVLPTAANELERRWGLNIFLNKWLEFCLDHRHVFGRNTCTLPQREGRDIGIVGIVTG